jgi:hypothetical protein
MTTYIILAIIFFILGLGCLIAAAIIFVKMNVSYSIAYLVARKTGVQMSAKDKKKKKTKGGKGAETGVVRKATSVQSTPAAAASVAPKKEESKKTDKKADKKAAKKGNKPVNAADVVELSDEQLTSITHAAKGRVAKVRRKDGTEFESTSVLSGVGSDDSDQATSSPASQAPKPIKPVAPKSETSATDMITSAGSKKPKMSAVAAQAIKDAEAMADATSEEKKHYSETTVLVGENAGIALDAKVEGAKSIFDTEDIGTPKTSAKKAAPAAPLAEAVDTDTLLNNMTDMLKKSAESMGATPVKSRFSKSADSKNSDFDPSIADTGKLVSAPPDAVMGTDKVITGTGSGDSVIPAKAGTSAGAAGTGSAGTGAGSGDSVIPAKAGTSAGSKATSGATATSGDLVKGSAGKGTGTGSATKPAAKPAAKPVTPETAKPVAGAGAPKAETPTVTPKAHRFQMTSVLTSTDESVDRHKSITEEFKLKNAKAAAADVIPVKTGTSAPAAKPAQAPAPAQAAKPVAKEETKPQTKAHRFQMTSVLTSTDESVDRHKSITEEFKLKNAKAAAETPAASAPAAKPAPAPVQNVIPAPVNGELARPGTSAPVAKAAPVAKPVAKEETKPQTKAHRFQMTSVLTSTDESVDRHKSITEEFKLKNAKAAQAPAKGGTGELAKPAPAPVAKAAPAPAQAPAPVKPVAKEETKPQTKAHRFQMTSVLTSTDESVDRHKSITEEFKLKNAKSAQAPAKGGTGEIAKPAPAPAAKPAPAPVQNVIPAKAGIQPAPAKPAQAPAPAKPVAKEETKQQSKARRFQMTSVLTSTDESVDRHKSITEEFKVKNAKSAAAPAQAAPAAKPAPAPVQNVIPAKAGIQPAPAPAAKPAPAPAPTPAPVAAPKQTTKTQEFKKKQAAPSKARRFQMTSVLTSTDESVDRHKSITDEFKIKNSKSTQAPAPAPSAPAPAAPVPAQQAPAAPAPAPASAQSQAPSAPAPAKAHLTAIQKSHVTKPAQVPLPAKGHADKAKRFQMTSVLTSTDKKVDHSKSITDELKK